MKNHINKWEAKKMESCIATWKSPSNIALLKYWGKLEGQLPVNPSLSFSLSEAYTITKITATPDKMKAGITALNKNPEHPFLQKIKPFWQTVIKEIPLLKDYCIEIETENTFPHSAGIASSASGFSALALCFLSLAEKLSGNQLAEQDFFQSASALSRQGSGSACRSVYGGFTVWGKTALWHNSSDLHAIGINEDIHSDFKNLHDAILLVSAKEKSLSSSKGHSLMNNHPFAGGRILQANKHLSFFKKALKEGDFNLLSETSEAEALSLHAVIMSSAGGEILLQPQSIELINRIRTARNKGLRIFFTIDAGPNIHLIYPEKEKINAENFIQQELFDICDKTKIIFDKTGNGATKIN